METPQVNRKQIDDLRAWFFAKDRSISLAQDTLYYLFAGGQANGAYISMAFIAETILSASAASVTFSNIPQDFRHLFLFTQAREDAAGEAGNLIARFNGDTGANYDLETLEAAGATVAAAGVRGGTSIRLGYMEGANSRGNNFGPTFAIFPGYSISGSEKLSLSIAGGFGNVSADADCVIVLRINRWRNTNVVSSILLLPGIGPNFVSGSRFSLYGVL